jgi:hypothetical protein
VGFAAPAMDRLIEGALKRLYPLLYLATVFPWPAGQAPGASAGGSGQKRKLAASDAESGKPPFLQKCRNPWSVLLSVACPPIRQGVCDQIRSMQRGSPRNPCRECPVGNSPANGCTSLQIRATASPCPVVPVNAKSCQANSAPPGADDASSAGDEIGAPRRKQQRGPAHEGSPSGSAEIAREAPPGPSSGIARPEDESEHGDSLPPPPTNAGDEEYLRADDGMEASPALAPVVAEAEDEGMHPDSLPPRDGGEMEVLRPPPSNIPRREADGSHHQDIVHGPAGSGDVISRSGDEMEPVVGLTDIAQPGRDESRRGRTRAANWTHNDTLKLIESKLRNLNWEAIASLISGRTGTQCRQRWDTLVRLHKRIKRHCDGHGKEFAEVTEAELETMKVTDHHWKSGNWYNMIDEFQRQRVSSGESHCSCSLAASAVSNLVESASCGWSP